MPKDIVVYVSTDTKPRAAEGLDILLLSTSGPKPPKAYTNLLEIEKDHGKEASVTKMAAVLFNQSAAIPPPDKLIRKVAIAGVESPDGPEALITSIEELRENFDDWFVFLTDKSDDEYVKALAAWAESTEPSLAKLEAGEEDHRKFYFGQTTSKNFDISNRRNAIIYTEDPERYMDAAWVGAVGPYFPRSVTWKFKRPEGSKFPELTAAEREAMETACLNFLTAEYKTEYIKNGVCSDGEPIDAQLGADYITRQMRMRLYKLFTETPNIPYSDDGFTQVASIVYAVLDEAVKLDIVAADPNTGAGIYAVNIPRFSDATEDQVRGRVMPDIPWEAQIAGAVHGVKVTGVLRAKLN